MGFRFLSAEKTAHLLEVQVSSHGCCEGFYECYGKFDTTHEYTCGFKPDDDWYRIATYSISDLRNLVRRGVTISYSYSCEYLKNLVEGYGFYVCPRNLVESTVESCSYWSFERVFTICLYYRAFPDEYDLEPEEEIQELAHWDEDIFAKIGNTRIVSEKEWLELMDELKLKLDHETQSDEKTADASSKIHNTMQQLYKIMSTNNIDFNNHVVILSVAA